MRARGAFGGRMAGVGGHGCQRSRSPQLRAPEHGSPSKRRRPPEAVAPAGPGGGGAAEGDARAGSGVAGAAISTSGYGSDGSDVSNWSCVTFDSDASAYEGYGEPSTRHGNESATGGQQGRAGREEADIRTFAPYQLDERRREDIALLAELRNVSPEEAEEQLVRKRWDPQGMLGRRGSDGGGDDDEDRGAGLRSMLKRIGKSSQDEELGRRLCPICMEDIGSSDAEASAGTAEATATVTFRGCHHICHRDCAVNYVKHTISSLAAGTGQGHPGSVSCPTCMAAGDEEQGFLPLGMVAQLVRGSRPPARSSPDVCVPMADVLTRHARRRERSTRTPSSISRACEPSCCRRIRCIARALEAVMALCRLLGGMWTVRRKMARGSTSSAVAGGRFASFVARPGTSLRRVRRCGHGEPPSKSSTRASNQCAERCMMRGRRSPRLLGTSTSRPPTTGTSMSGTPGKKRCVA